MSRPVPTTPDGKPDFGVLNKPSPTGGVSIWDIPSDLTDALAMSGGKLWFDTGHKKVTTYQPIPGITEPGVVGDYQAPVYGSANAAEAGMERTASHSIKAYDIMRKPEQIMAQFAAMSANDPAQFIALQKALASGPWGSVNLNGVFDANTESALGNAMLQYVKLSVGTGAAMSFTDYLMTMGSRAQALGGDGTSMGSGGAGSQPTTIQVTDPDTITAAAQQAAQTALGRTLKEGELNAFVQQFQDAQRTYQTAQSGVISAPDLSTESEKFVQEGHPKEFKQNNEQAYYSLLVNMLSSGAQRPNQEPVAPVR